MIIVAVIIERLKNFLSTGRVEKINRFVYYRKQNVIHCAIQFNYFNIVHKGVVFLIDEFDCK